MQQYLDSLVISIFRLCVWLVLLALIFIPLERIFARHRQKIFRKDWGADLGYYFLNSLLPNLLLIIPLSLLMRVIHNLEPLGFYNWSASFSPIERLGLAIVIGEFGAYWGHRWSHEIPFLWRFHAIHHSAEEMDWLVNTRAHPIDMAFTRLCGLIPIYLLGLARTTGNTTDWVPIIYVLVGTIWSFFVHANINWRFGLLEKIIATPAFHHWHHTNDGEKYIDKNYAAIFPWVDKIFGTLYLPPRWPEKYGIEKPIAPSFAGQLIEPIKKAIE